MAIEALMPDEATDTTQEDLQAPAVGQTVPAATEPAMAAASEPSPIEQLGIGTFEPTAEDLKNISPASDKFTNDLGIGTFEPTEDDLKRATRLQKIMHQEEIAMPSAPMRLGYALEHPMDVVKANLNDFMQQTTLSAGQMVKGVGDLANIFGLGLASVISNTAEDNYQAYKEGRWAPDNVLVNLGSMMERNTQNQFFNQATPTPESEAWTMRKLNNGLAMVLTNMAVAGISAGAARTGIVGRAGLRLAPEILGAAQFSEMAKERAMEMGATEGQGNEVLLGMMPAVVLSNRVIGVIPIFKKAAQEIEGNLAPTVWNVTQRIAKDSVIGGAHTALALGLQTEIQGELGKAIGVENEINPETGELIPKTHGQIFSDAVSAAGVGFVMGAASGGAFKALNIADSRAAYNRDLASFKEWYSGLKDNAGNPWNPENINAADAAFSAVYKAKQDALAAAYKVSSDPKSQEFQNAFTKAFNQSGGEAMAKPVMEQIYTRVANEMGRMAARDSSKASGGTTPRTDAVIGEQVAADVKQKMSASDAKQRALEEQRRLETVPPTVEAPAEVSPKPEEVITSGVQKEGQQKAEVTQPQEKEVTPVPPVEPTKAEVPPPVEPIVKPALSRTQQNKLNELTKWVATQDDTARLRQLYTSYTNTGDKVFADVVAARLAELKEPVAPDVTPIAEVKPAPAAKEVIPTAPKPEPVQAAGPKVTPVTPPEPTAKEPIAPPKKMSLTEQVEQARLENERLKTEQQKAAAPEAKPATEVKPVITTPEQPTGDLLEQAANGTLPETPLTPGEVALHEAGPETGGVQARSLSEIKSAKDVFPLIKSAIAKIADGTYLAKARDLMNRLLTEGHSAEAEQAREIVQAVEAQTKAVAGLKKEGIDLSDPKQFNKIVVEKDFGRDIAAPENSRGGKAPVEDGLVESLSESKGGMNFIQRAIAQKLFSWGIVDNIDAQVEHMLPDVQNELRIAIRDKMANRQPGEFTPEEASDILNTAVDRVSSRYSRIYNALKAFGLDHFAEQTLGEAAMANVVEPEAGSVLQAEREVLPQEPDFVKFGQSITNVDDKIALQTYGREEVNQGAASAKELQALGDLYKRLSAGTAEPTIQNLYTRAQNDIKAFEEGAPMGRGREMQIEDALDLAKRFNADPASIMAVADRGRDLADQYRQEQIKKYQEFNVVIRSPDELGRKRLPTVGPPPPKKMGVLGMAKAKIARWFGVKVEVNAPPENLDLNEFQVADDKFQDAISSVKSWLSQHGIPLTLMPLNGMARRSFDGWSFVRTGYVDPVSGEKVSNTAANKEWAYVDKNGKRVQPDTQEFIVINSKTGESRQEILPYGLTPEQAVAESNRKTENNAAAAFAAKKAQLQEQNAKNAEANARNVQAKNKKPILSDTEIEQQAIAAREKVLAKQVDTAYTIMTVGQSNAWNVALSKYADAVPIEEAHSMFDSADPKTKADWKDTWNAIHDKLEPSYKILAKAFAVQKNSNLPLFAAHYLNPRPLANMPGLVTLTMHIPDVKAADGSVVLENNDLNHVPGAQNITAWVTGYETSAVDPATGKTRKVFYVLEVQRAKGFHPKEEEYNPRLAEALGQHLPPPGSPEAESGEYQPVKPMQGSGSKAMWYQMFEKVAQYAKSKGMDVMIPDAENALRIQGYYDPSGESYKLTNYDTKQPIVTTRVETDAAGNKVEVSTPVTKPEVTFLRDYYSPDEEGSVHEVARMVLGDTPNEQVDTVDAYEAAPGHAKFPGTVGGILYRSENFIKAKGEQEIAAPKAESPRALYPEPGSNGRVTTEEIHPDDVHPDQRPMVDTVLRKVRMLMPKTKVVFTRIADGDGSDPLTFSATAYHPDKDTVTVNITALQALYENGQSGKSLSDMATDPNFQAFLHFALMHEKTHQAISKTISAGELRSLWDSLNPEMQNALLREYYQLPDGTKLSEAQKEEAGNEYLRRAYELVSEGKTSEEMVNAIGTPKEKNWFVRIVKRFASMLSKNFTEGQYEAELMGIRNNPLLLEKISQVDNVVRDHARDAGSITFEKSNIKYLFDHTAEEDLRQTRDAINRKHYVYSILDLNNGFASAERVLGFVDPRILANLPPSPSAEMVYSVIRRKLQDPGFVDMLAHGANEFTSIEKNAAGNFEAVKRTVNPDDIKTWLAKATLDNVRGLVDVVKARQAQEGALGMAPLRRPSYGEPFYLQREQQGETSRALEELDNGGRLTDANLEAIAKGRAGLTRVPSKTETANAYAKLSTPEVKQIPGSPAAKLLALLGHDSYEGGATLTPFDQKMAKELPDVFQALQAERQPLGMAKIDKNPQVGLVANIKRWMQKKFTSKGALTDYEAVFTAIAQRDNSIDAEMARVSYNNDKLAAAVKLAEKDIRSKIPDKAAATEEFSSLHSVMDMALKDKNNRVAWDYLETNYPKIADNLYDLRNHIDALSLKLADSGFISEGLQGTILENLGVYLNRSYRIHDIDPSTNKSPWAENMKRVMIGDIHPGSKEDLAMEQILNTARNYGFDWLVQKKASTWKNFADYLKAKKASDPEQYKDVPLGGKPLVEYMASDAGRTEIAKFANEIKRGEAHYGDRDIVVQPVEVETLLGDLLDLTEKDIQEAISTGKIAKNIGRSLGILQQRKNLPEEIRALWGEYTEADSLYPKTVQKLSGLIANDRLVNGVNDILADPNGPYGQLVFDSREAALRAGVQRPVRLFPESEKRYGPLAGAYGPEFIRDALVDATDRAKVDPMMKATMSIVGTALAAKTTLSLQAGIRNFIGNIVPALSNGYFFNSGVVGRLGKGAAGMRNIAVDAILNRFGRNKEAAQDYYEKLLRLGVIDENVTVGILKDISADISRLNIHQSGIEKVMAYLFEKTSAVRKQTDAWYQGMDNFWKVFAFETELANHMKAYPDKPIGDVEKLAAQKVRDVTFTYALTPAITKELRRSVLGVHFAPFIAFTLEVIRTNKNIFKYSLQEISEGRATGNTELAKIGAKRLMGALIGHFAIMGAVEAISRMQGVDDDEEKAIRRFLPPWQKASMLMPLKIEQGAVTLTDVSFTNPWAYFYQPFIAAIKTDEGTFTRTMAAALGKVVEPFTNPQIFTRAVMEATLGRTLDSQTGRPIYLEGDSPEDKALKGAFHIWKAIEPGVITSTRRISMGVLGTESKSGRVYDPAIELESALTGMRVQRYDIAKQLQNSGYNFTQNVQAATRVLNDAIYPKGATTESAVSHAYQQSDNVRFIAYQTLFRDIQAARRLGVSEMQIRQVMKDSGVSNVIMRDILRGVYRQIAPNQSALDKLRTLPDRMVRLQGIRDGQSQVPLTRAMEPQ